MEQELKDNLLRVTDFYASATGRKKGWIARMAIGNNRFFESFDTGGFTIRSYDNIMQWLSDRWPAGLEWPAGVTRPVPKSLPVPVVASDDEEAEERLPEQQEA